MSPVSAGSSAPEAHLALYLYAAFIRIMQDVARNCDGLDSALERWPFLRPYVGEVAEHGLDGVPLGEAAQRWTSRIATFEAEAGGHLPLRGLARAYALDQDDLIAIAACLWPDTEARFAVLFQSLHGIDGEARPTGPMLARWRGGGESRIRDLMGLGLLEPVRRDAPFSMRGIFVPELLADALRGRAPPDDAQPLAYRPVAQLTALDALVLPDALRRSLTAAAGLLAGGALDALVIRGPARNGRRTLARAVARLIGRGTVEYAIAGPDPVRLDPGPLAVALGALPVVRAEPAIGETIALPPRTWRRIPLVVTLPPQGGIAFHDDARVLELARELPDVGERAAMWRAGIDDAPDPAAAPATLARRWRMSGGAIARTIAGARVHAAVDRRAAVGLADLTAARRTLGREALDTLANPVANEAGWSSVITSEETRAELVLLEARCRQREALCGSLGGSVTGPGVRALFKGASGTGKTLAARALAGVLGMDLYRVNLAAVTSKFVGETEKNLDKVLSAAEMLDVALLLDEGDALLGARTTTHSANDRFANLETNFLLQRLEAFHAILVVTTNAAENIDSAFERRMDVVVEFRAPGSEERAAIWRLHLPPDHRVPSAWLDEVAWRCTLTGGQIRNAVLHAALLALDAAGPIGVDHVAAAVEREYRKSGTVCPLRRIALVRG